MKQARLDQLADSIFAIVMTILVFEIRIPEYAGVVSEQTLWKSLLELSPIFLSYLLSFSLLFTYWRSHHFIESILAKNIDTQFSNLNAIFFFFVGLVPFSSHLLGKYSYSETAIIFFAMNIILIGLSLYRMRQYVIHSKTIENASVTKTQNEHANMHILFPVGAGVVAIVVSFFSSYTAIFLFTVAILFNLLEKSTKYTFFFIDIFRKKH
ncbi:MAG: TMEM175 family protein [Candidatus Paceibacterota bacterium]